MQLVMAAMTTAPFVSLALDSRQDEEGVLLVMQQAQPSMLPASTECVARGSCEANWARKSVRTLSSGSKSWGRFGPARQGTTVSSWIS